MLYIQLNDEFNRLILQVSTVAPDTNALTLKAVSPYNNEVVTVALGNDLSPHKERYSEYQVNPQDFAPLGLGFSDYAVYPTASEDQVIDRGYIHVKGDPIPVAIELPGTSNDIIVFGNP